MTEKKTAEELAEAFADSKERRLTSYWKGLKHGYMEEHDKARNQAIQDCIDKLIEGGWSGDLDHNVRKLFVDLESLKTNQT